MLLSIFMILAFVGNGYEIAVVYSNEILLSGNAQADATLWSLLTITGDLLGLFLGLFLIERFQRRALFLTTLSLLALTDFSFSLFGYLDLLQIYKFGIFILRLLFSMGMASVLWGYVPDILPLNGVTFAFSFMNALIAI